LSVLLQFLEKIQPRERKNNVFALKTFWLRHHLPRNVPTRVKIVNATAMSSMVQAKMDNLSQYLSKKILHMVLNQLLEAQLNVVMKILVTQPQRTKKLVSARRLFHSSQTRICLLRSVLVRMANAIALVLYTLVSLMVKMASLAPSSQKTWLRQPLRKEACPAVPLNLVTQPSARRSNVSVSAQSHHHLCQRTSRNVVMRVSYANVTDRFTWVVSLVNN
jgi:hypothetical protein